MPNLKKKLGKGNMDLFEVADAGGLGDNDMMKKAKEIKSATDEAREVHKGLTAKTALVIVDIQNDFCEGGPVAVPGSLDVIPLINELREKDTFHYVVTTRDWHPDNHVSFAETHPGKDVYTEIWVPQIGEKQFLWPTHCVMGSQGANYHQLLTRKDTDIEIKKGQLPNVESYSAFGSKGETTELKKKLEELNVKNVVCVGLAYNFCVGSTAVDAAKNGFTTILVEDATRATADSASVDAMKEKLDGAGVYVVQSADVAEKVKYLLLANQAAGVGMKEFKKHTKSEGEDEEEGDGDE